ncbi:MAG TPA: PHB depolymerase family esterase [Labilithrix sp.]|nr:PHB depolymerase family esterase [Labilithrix sp.]
MKGAVAALSAAAALVALLAASRARAEVRPKITDICPGCLATVPQASEPAPLLVVLHGDYGFMAPELHKAWERFAAPRGVALLSLSCPSDLGCKRSWWQWDGDPAWITVQVERLASRHALDRERLWIAGWSGGASYIGMRTQELERSFAALVIHGGGVGPSRSGCAVETAARARVVFLVGDKNPLHDRAVRLREHYEACGNEVSWRLLPGAEHTGEWSGLDKSGGEILDLLATKRRIASKEQEPRPAATVAASPPAAASAPPPAPAPTAQGPAPMPTRMGCGCHVTSRSTTPAEAWLGVARAVVALRRRVWRRRLRTACSFVHTDRAVRPDRR